MSDPPVALIFNSELDATADVSRSAMLTTKEDLPTYSPPGNAYSINIFVTTSYLNSAFYTNTYWDTNLGDLTVEDYNALIQAGNNNLSGQPKTFLFDWSSITTNTSDLDRLDSNVFNGAGDLYNFVSQNDLADATVQTVSGLLYNISFLGSVWYNHPSAITNFANFMSPIVTVSKLVETLEKVNAPELSEYRDDFFNQAYLKYKYDERDYSKLAFSAGDSLTIPIKFDISQHVRYNLCGSPVENHPNNMLTFVVDTQEYVVMKEENTTNTQVYLLNFVATDYDPTIYQLIIQNGVLLRHTGTAPANVVIPAEVTSIASNVFKNNTTVESVSFDGTSVVSIGYEAFSGCTSLTSLPLPAGLAVIEGSAFLRCSSLTSIVIPDSVTFLGNHLLDRCSLLASLTLPTNIGDVPEHLCADCTNLTSIVIPDSVTHIGGLAFANCTSLTSITISSSLTNIDNGAFFQCTGITSLTHIVTLAESLQNTTSSVNIFGFVLDGITGPPPSFVLTYTGSVVTGYTGDLPSVLTIPPGASGIGPEAFANETGLFSVTIPNSVTTLGENAFINCTSLTSVVLPGTLACTNDENTATNGDGAFVGCTSITNITLSNGIAYIPGGLFANCSSLSSVTFPASVTAIGDFAFGGCAITDTTRLVGLPSAFWGDSDVLRIFGTQLTGFVVDGSGVAVGYLGTLPTAVTLPSGISGISPTLFAANTTIESLVIPNSVTNIPDSAFAICSSLTSVTLGASTEAIGIAAFYQCIALISITLPNSVTSIGYAAFQHCDALTSVDLGSGLLSLSTWVFSYCGELTSIVLPQGVTSIPDKTFFVCSKLASVTMGSAVTSVGGYAFMNCFLLESIVLSTTVESIGEYGFLASGLTSITIPNSVTSLDQYAFSSCPALTSIVLGSGLERIGDYTFAGCSLQTLTIPNSVTYMGSGWIYLSPNLTSLTLPPTGTFTMGQYAVYGCPSLASIVIPPGFRIEVPEGGNQIYYNSFSSFIGCTSLTSVVVQSGVTALANYMFSGCSVLTNLTLPASVTSIGEAAFNYTGLPSEYIAAPYAPYLYPIPFQLTIVDHVVTGYTGTLVSSLTIPEGVTGIDSNVFSDETGLTSVSLPSTLTSIGGGAFSGTGLTSVVIPNTVSIVEYDTFLDCTSLSSVTLGSGVTSIGNTAFAGCSALSSITIPSNVLSLGTSSFQSTPLTSVVIPNSLTSIGASAFMACTALTSLTIGSSVEIIGSLAFGGCSTLTSVSFPNSVETIGAQAFFECADLTSITFGTGVTSIGDGAFDDCIDMVVSGQVVNLPVAFQSESEQIRIFGEVDPAYVFVVASDVITGYIGVLPTALVIPDSVLSIGPSVFGGSTTLSSITFGAGVTEIGYVAFANCTTITSITFGESVTTIGEGAFYGCAGITEFSQLVGFPASLTNNTDISRIFGKTFDALLVSGTTLNGYIGTLPSPLTIPAGITTIAEAAFHDCTGLTSVDFGANVVSILDYAFIACTALTSVTFPDSVETIGVGAFQQCSDLTSITFGTGVTSIGDNAFDDCIDMVVSGQVHNLPAAFQSESEQIRIFGEVDPNYVLIVESEVVTGYYGVLPSEITISNNIAASAFSGSTTLTSITFGAGVTTIGNNAFSGCTGITGLGQLVGFPASLTNDTDISRIFGKTFTGFIISGTTLLGYNGTIPDPLVIPDEIETIAASAFAASYPLTSITFGANVTAIGDSAFAACANITLLSQLVNFPASLTNNTDITRIFGKTLYGLLVSGTTLTGYLGTLPSPFTVPSGIQTIGSNAFLNTVGLTSLTLNASLTLIDVNAFGGCTGLGSLVLNASIQSVNASAFAGCTALTSITFAVPTSISTIGSNAFYNMPLITAPSHVLNMPSGFRTTLSENYIFGKTLYALTIGGTAVTGYTGNLPSALTIPAGITVISFSVFCNATTIASLTLPTSLQGIATNAFAGCTGLTSLTLPTSIQTINGSAFAGCTALSNITFTAPTSLSGSNSIGNGAFYNTPLITAPSQVSNIPSLFLTYLDETRIFGRTLYSLETSNNVISSYSGILPYALTIPDGITTINTAAFSNANTITSLTLPTSIQTINGSAFAGCTTLSSLTFTTPTNITTIGCNAFFGATALSQMVQISNMPESFKVNASQRQIFGKTMYTLFVSNNVVTGAAGTLPSTVTIPAGVTCIGTGAFSIANVSYANTTFIIGNTVQTICANAFYGTTNYNSFYVTVSLGTSVSHIGSNAFAYMIRLSDLFIPSNVVTIDSGAFTQTGGLAGVFRMTGMQGVTSLSAPAFSNTGAISISLGSNLSNIGPSVFASSAMLTSVTIPAAVTTIGASAFSSMAALSTVTFATPTTIASIGNNAFAYNGGITRKNQMVNIPSSFLTSTSMTQIFGKQLT